MNLIVEHFLGIKKAGIKLSDKITLIAGPNGSGKTSMIQALQCLVTGEPIPLPGLKKKDAKALVHNDETSGRALLVSDADTEIGIGWPSCKVGGTKFTCSPYAAGMSLPACIPAKDLTAILGVLPTFQDFESELMLPDQSKVIWTKIQQSGWDQAHAQAMQTGRDLKREWEKLSGENWGVNQAKGWTPADYIEQTEEELQAALKTAQKLYEHAIKAEAIDEKEKQNLQRIANEYDTVLSKIKNLTAEISATSVELTKAQGLLQELPKILNQEQAYECWHCKKLGIIQDGRLIEAPDTKQSQDDIDALRGRQMMQNTKIRTLQEKREELNVSLRETKNRLTQCEAARKKLNEVILDAPPAALSQNDARSEVELCQKRILAYKTKGECDELYELLGYNSIICAVLHPDGLRKQVLAAKLANFNELLAIICETAGWPAVTIDEYLDIRFNQRPYVLLSVGEKFAVNAVLQIALAKMDGSQILIMDGFDVLDSKYRNGLITILDSLPIPTVIGCTFGAESDVPNFEGLGLTYWCENGGVVQISKELVAA